MAKRPTRRGRKKPKRIRWALAPIVDRKDAAAVKRARSELRELIDRVLGAGRNALDSHAHPFSQVIRAIAETDMASVREWRANPFKAFSLEVWWACLRLAELSTKAHEAELVSRFRTAKATSKQKKTQAPGIRARHENLLKILSDNDRSLDKSELTGWLVNKVYGAAMTEKQLSTRTRKMDRDLEALRKRRT